MEDAEDIERMQLRIYQSDRERLIGAGLEG